MQSQDENPARFGGRRSPGDCLMADRFADRALGRSLQTHPADLVLVIIAGQEPEPGGPATYSAPRAARRVIDHDSTRMIRENALFVPVIIPGKHRISVIMNQPRRPVKLVTGQIHPTGVMVTRYGLVNSWPPGRPGLVGGKRTRGWGTRAPRSATEELTTLPAECAVMSGLRCKKAGLDCNL
jgi:hypothetical protein